MKEKIMCKTHCIVWNDIDKDCEIYGEHHPCPRRCLYYQTHTAFQHVKEVDRMRDTLTEKEKQTERLQEQLNEANEVIKKYATGTFKMRCRKYEGTAVGTDIITGEPVSEELYGGYYYSDIPMSNKTDVAKKYLKKWGVK